MTETSTDLMVAYLVEGLAAAANPADAKAMAAYMKTTMPFYGVKKPVAAALFKDFRAKYKVETAETYVALIEALWAEPHRESKHLAIDVARRYKDFITLERLPLYESMIRDGAWWDFVDTIAKNLIGRLLVNAPDTVAPIMNRWIDDDDMWIRRSAILSQLGRKDGTDAEMLFRFSLHCAHETEFFIRKAIGWALRDYSYAAPDAVAGFLAENKEDFSGLTYREGARILKKQGWDL